MRDHHLPFSAEALLKISHGLDADSVVYVANLENHPEIVAALAEKRRLLGNGPDTLRRIRDWRLLRRFCDEAQILSPAVRMPGEEFDSGPASTWLEKPARGGSGHGIRFWAGDSLEPSQVLQSYVQGRSMSAAFVADGTRCVLIALTEQMIGVEELGATGFTWCGNILPFEFAPDSQELTILQMVSDIASRLTAEFGLVGANGIDLVLAEGPDGVQLPHLIEVNPRYTASMELVELAHGCNIFSMHLDAVAGHLPDFCLSDYLQGPSAYFAKGIVFARCCVTIPDTADWAAKGRRDIPFPGEKIEAGHPVCTVLAQADSRNGCWNQLLHGAAMVRREISDER